jgi:glycosyltransferase involved in cell wall biosynthesis
MRLAVVTQTRSRVGGLETYLEAVLPGLARVHDVAFFSVDGESGSRGAVALPAGVPALHLDRTAGDPVDVLRRWQPDVLFAHGLDDSALEAEVLRVAPAVIVQHTFHGTCISSGKTMTWPAVTQCDRAFGSACLAMYFPRRCGGSNPLTMLRLYRIQAQRLRALQKAAAVVTLSEHMAKELRHNGVRAERVHVVPPFVDATDAPPAVTVSDVCRLLYVGRLERLKGVDRLLLALPMVADRLHRDVRLVVAGDGAERHRLEAQAAEISKTNRRLSIIFAGWQDDNGRTRLLSDADALVVPSLWPEPFGLVGIEAAVCGVPAVAFATGGIPEWLREGENGCLAPAAGARPELLADAIGRCTASPETLSRLRTGARESAARWTLDRHLNRLDAVFQQTAGSSACAVPA